MQILCVKSFISKVDIFGRRANLKHVQLVNFTPAINVSHICFAITHLVYIVIIEQDYVIWIYRQEYLQSLCCKACIASIFSKGQKLIVKTLQGCQMLQIRYPSY